MTSALKWKATTAVLIAAFAWQQRAFGEVVLVQSGGWTATTDGRVNSFISTDWGNGIPESSPDYVGTVTRDRTHDAAGNIAGTRIRNGFFLSSILAFESSGHPEPQGNGARGAVDEHLERSHEEQQRPGGPA